MTWISCAARAPRRLVALALAAALAGACTTAPEQPSARKTTIGGLGGAVAGGLLGGALGGRTRDVLAGAAVGGLVGLAVGNLLDQRDRELAQRNASDALETQPTGMTSAWQNPDTGNYGSFTPTHTYQEPSGRYCREYQQEIVVGGERQQAFGTACRMPDGTWQVVS